MSSYEPLAQPTHEPVATLVERYYPHVEAIGRAAIAANPLTNRHPKRASSGEVLWPSSPTGLDGYTAYARLDTRDIHDASMDEVGFTADMRADGVWHLAERHYSYRLHQNDPAMNRWEGNSEALHAMAHFDPDNRTWTVMRRQEDVPEETPWTERWYADPSGLTLGEKITISRTGEDMQMVADIARTLGPENPGAFRELLRRLYSRAHAAAARTHNVDELAAVGLVVNRKRFMEDVYQDRFCVSALTNITTVGPELYQQYVTQGARALDVPPFEPMGTGKKARVPRLYDSVSPFGQ